MAKAILALVLLKQKKYSAAFKWIGELDKSPTMFNEYQAPCLCYAYALSGDISRAKKELANSLKEYPDKQVHYLLSYVYIAFKNYNEALNQLEEAYPQHNFHSYWIKVDPVMDPLRNEPRFKTLMKKMNLE